MTIPWEIRGHFPFGGGFAALGTLRLGGESSELFVESGGTAKFLFGGLRAFLSEPTLTGGF
jgi:hypothetical protein